jgi:hypothetical protein
MLEDRLMLKLYRDNGSEIDTGKAVKVEANSKYTIVDAKSGKSPANVKIKRNNENLEIYEEGAETPDIILEEYFADGTNAQLNGFNESGSYLPYSTSEDGSSLTLALSDAENASTLSSLLNASGENSLTDYLTTGLTGVGASLLGGLASSGSDSAGTVFSGNSNSSGGSSIGIVNVPVITQTNQNADPDKAEVTVVAGPIVDKGLVADIFNADGDSILKAPIVLDEYGAGTGPFKSGISGGLTMSVVQSDVDEYPDYMNEGTREATDLEMTLRTIVNNGNGSVFVYNTTTLTELMVQMLGYPSSDGGDNLSALTTDALDEMASLISQAFGIDESINAHKAIPIINRDGTINYGANEYGVALGLLAGMDQVTGSMQATFDLLKSGMALSHSNVDNLTVFSDDLITAMAEGMAYVEKNSTPDFVHDTVLQIPELAALEGVATGKLDSGSKIYELTPAEISVLPTDYIIYAAPADIAQMSTAQVKGMTQIQVAALMEDQVMALTGEQLLAMAQDHTIDELPYPLSASQITGPFPGTGLALEDLDTAYKQNLFNDLLKEMEDADMDSMSELQRIESIIDRIFQTAGGGTPSPALTVDDLTFIGLEDVVTGNLAATLGNIAGYASDSVGDDTLADIDTLAELQAMVGVLTESAALSVIKAYADDNADGDYTNDVLLNDDASNNVNDAPTATHYKAFEIAPTTAYINERLAADQTGMLTEADIVTAYFDKYLPFANNAVDQVAADTISSSTDVKKLFALGKISTHTLNRLSLFDAPTLQDYIDAGYNSRIGASDLEQVNTLVAALTDATDVDTFAELDALLDARDATIIQLSLWAASDENSDYADAVTAGTYSGNPTKGTYAAVGVDGVTDDNIDIMNALLVSQYSTAGANSADAISEVIERGLAIEKVANYAGDNTKDAPTETDYDTLLNDDSLVSSADVELINTLIDAQDAADVDTYQEIYDLIQAQKDALQKIADYADSNANSAPDEIDYAAAGVIGVSVANLAAVNNAVDQVTRTEADSVSEVQTLVSVARISAYAEDNTNAAPTVEDYEAVGAKRVSADNLAIVNETIDQLYAAADVDTAAEIKNAVSLGVIRAYSEGATTAPALDDYTNLGITGVDSVTLNAVNAAIEASDKAGTDTTGEIQDLVTAALLVQQEALAKITAFATNYDANTDPATIPAAEIPTTDDYSNAGISGIVTDPNTNSGTASAWMNTIVKAHEGTDADSVAEVQALASIAKISTYAASSNNLKPTYEDYYDLGLSGLNGAVSDQQKADLADYINRVVELTAYQDADTKSEIQALVAIAKIAAYAEDSSNPAPTVSDFATAGVNGVNSDNFATVLSKVDAERFSNADSVSDIERVLKEAFETFSIDKIVAYANNNTNPAPGVSDYEAVGFSSANADNLAAINRYIDAYIGEDVDTAEKVQSIAEAALNGEVSDGSVSKAELLSDGGAEITFGLPEDADVGDSVEITLDDDDALTLASAIFYTLTSDDITNGYGTVKLTESEFYESGNYTVTVKVDGQNTGMQLPFLYDIEGPEITSDDFIYVGDGTASGSTISTVTSRDLSSVTYSIVDNANDDSSKFTIDASTGKIKLAFTPDYDVPIDVGTDNDYSFTVLATDALGQTSTMDMTVRVVELAAAPTNIDISDDTGKSASDFITNKAAQTVTATLAQALGSNEKLMASLDGGSTWTDITSSVSNTSVSWSTSLESGSNKAIAMKVIDSVGLSGEVASQSYLLDTLAPSWATSASTNITIEEGHSTSTSIFAPVTKADASGTNFSLNGQSASGFNINQSGFVYFKNAPVYSSSGSNTMTFQWKVEDGAGNMMTKDVTVTVTRAMPVVSNVSFSDDTGSSDSDLITNVATQTISAALNKELQNNELLWASIDNGTNWVNITSSVANKAITWDDVTLSGSSTLKFKVTNLDQSESGQVTSAAYQIILPGSTPNVYQIENTFGQAVTDYVRNKTEDALYFQTPFATGTWTFSIDGGTTFQSSNLSNTTQFYIFKEDATSIYTPGMIVVKGATDAAGNTQTWTNSNTYVIDREPPELTGASYTKIYDSADLKNYYYYKLTFSEKVSLGSISNTSTINGDLNLVETPKSYDGGLNWLLKLTSYSNYPETHIDIERLSTAKDLHGNPLDQPRYSGGAYHNASASSTTGIDLTYNGALTNLALSDDNGTSSSDGITDTADQTVSATLPYALETGMTVKGSVDRGTTWTDITSSVSGTTISWSTTLSGSNAVKLQLLKDGSVISETSLDYVIDTVDPTFSSGASVTVNEGVATTTAVYNAEASDALSGVATYSLSGTDQSLFTIDSTTGKLFFKSSPDYSNPADSGGNNVYDVNVIATDTAGNTTSQAVAITVKNFYGSNGPQITSMSLSNDTGVSSSDFITSSASQTVTARLTAQLETGDLLKGSLDGGSTWTNITNKIASNGLDISWDGVTLPGSSGTIAMKIEYDGSSTSTSALVSHGYTLKTAAAIPTIVSVTDDVGTATGTIANNGSTDDTTPTVRVSLTGMSLGEKLYLAEAGLGALLTHTLDTADISRGYVDLTVPASKLSSGNTYTLQVKYSDLAGNMSNASSHAISVEDTDAPVFSSSGNVTQNLAAYTEGTIYSAAAKDNGGTVNYTLSGADASPFSISSSGALTLTSALDYSNPSDANSDNTYTFDIVATDSSGNSARKTISLNVQDAYSLSGTVNGVNMDTWDLILPKEVTIDGITRKFYIIDRDGNGTINHLDKFSHTMLEQIINNGNDTTDAYESRVNTSLIDNTTVMMTSLRELTALNAQHGTSSAIVDGWSASTLHAADKGTKADYHNIYSGSSSSVSVYDSTSAWGVFEVIQNESVAPVFTSATTISLQENNTYGSTVYTATTTDSSIVTYALSGSDASMFTIDSNSGVVKLKRQLDYETDLDSDTDGDYEFTVTATDIHGNASTQNVTLSVTDQTSENNVIDLGYDANSDHRGYLINPVTDGNGDSWYVWSDDLDGYADEISFEDLESIFEIDSDWRDRTTGDSLVSEIVSGKEIILEAGAKDNGVQTYSPEIGDKIAGLVDDIDLDQEVADFYGWGDESGASGMWFAETYISRNNTKAFEAFFWRNDGELTIAHNGTSVTDTNVALFRVIDA